MSKRSKKEQKPSLKQLMLGSTLDGYVEASRTLDLTEIPDDSNTCYVSGEPRKIVDEKDSMSEPKTDRRAALDEPPSTSPCFAVNLSGAVSHYGEFAGQTGRSGTEPNLELVQGVQSSGINQVSSKEE